jgi:hypothetical protein
MKVPEITDRYIDVQHESKRALARRSQARRLSESIDQDRENFKIVAGSITHYGVPESQLIIGQYYYPVNVSADISHQVILIHMCLVPAKFIGAAASRLIFKYDTSDTTMRFPQDEWLSDDEIGAVADSEKNIKMMYSILAARYSNTDWEFEVFTYDPATSKPVKLI